MWGCNLNDNKLTGDLLIELRKSLGITQKDVSTRFNVTPQAVSKWERGENLPESKHLLSLSRFYNVSVEEILIGKKMKNEDLYNQKRLSKYLYFFGCLLFLISLLLRITEQDTSGYLDVTSIIFMSFGVFVLLLAVPITESYKLLIKNKVIVSTTIVIYFSVNYIYDYWEYTWVLFLIMYNLLHMINKKETPFC